MKQLLVLVALVATSCAAPPPGQNPAIARVAAAQKALTAAGKAVIACYQVPRCSAVAPHAAIRRAYDTAYETVTAAQAEADAGGTPSMTASAAALASLSAILAPLPPT
jgi:hypothetical protein